MEKMDLSLLEAMLLLQEEQQVNPTEKKTQAILLIAEIIHDKFPSVHNWLSIHRRLEELRDGRTDRN